MKHDQLWVTDNSETMADFFFGHIPIRLPPSSIKLKARKSFWNPCFKNGRFKNPKFKLEKKKKKISYIFSFNPNFIFPICYLHLKDLKNGKGWKIITIDKFKAPVKLGYPIYY